MLCALASCWRATSAALRLSMIGQQRDADQDRRHSFDLISFTPHPRFYRRLLSAPPGTLPAVYPRAQRAHCRFLPSFCFSKSFPFTRNIPAVALGNDVLTNRADSLPRNHPAADTPPAPRSQTSAAESISANASPAPAALIRLIAMANNSQRIHRLAAHQHIQLHQIRSRDNPTSGNPKTRTPAKRCSTVVKIQNDSLSGISRKSS